MALVGDVPGKLVAVRRRSVANCYKTTTARHHWHVAKQQAINRQVTHLYICDSIVNRLHWLLCPSPPKKIWNQNRVQFPPVLGSGPPNFLIKFSPLFWASSPQGESFVKCTFWPCSCHMLAEA